MKIFEGIFIKSVMAEGGVPSPTTSTPQGGAFGMFVPMILVFAIFYFLLIRPQAKQRKKHEDLLKNLKKGDQVVTASGIHGKIAAITDPVITLEVAENLRFKMEKAQVVSIKPSNGGP